MAGVGEREGKGGEREGEGERGKKGRKKKRGGKRRRDRGHLAASSPPPLISTVGCADDDVSSRRHGFTAGSLSILTPTLSTTNARYCDISGRYKREIQEGQ